MLWVSDVALAVTGIRTQNVLNCSCNGYAVISALQFMPLTILPQVKTQKYYGGWELNMCEKASHSVPANVA